MTSYIRTAYGSSRGQRLLTLPFVLSIALFSIMVSALAMTEAAAASPAVWTAADRKAADDLAFQIVSSAPPNSLTLNLDPLVDALANSHQLDQARSLMRAASAPVLAGTDWALRYTLLAEEMGKIGDATDAIGLIPGASSSTDRNQALELIAVGAAKGGRVADAAKIANDIISNASADELQSVGGPLAETAGGSAQTVIFWLGVAGDGSDVEALVSRLPDGTARFRAEEAQASLVCAGDSPEAHALIGEMKSEIRRTVFELARSRTNEPASWKRSLRPLHFAKTPRPRRRFSEAPSCQRGSQPTTSMCSRRERWLCSTGEPWRWRCSRPPLTLRTWQSSVSRSRRPATPRPQRVLRCRRLPLGWRTRNTASGIHRTCGFCNYSNSFKISMMPLRSSAASSDAGERVQDDSVIIDAEIKQRNVDALTKTVAAMLGDIGPRSSIRGLETTAEELALGHFPGPAQQVFNAWEASQTLLKGEPLIEAEVRFAADMGDGDDAIKMAEENGPLVDHPNALSTVGTGPDDTGRSQIAHSRPDRTGAATGTGFQSTGGHRHGRPFTGTRPRLAWLKPAIFLRR